MRKNGNHNFSNANRLITFGFRSKVIPHECVVQLVEQLTFNQWVGGSSPLTLTTNSLFLLSFGRTGLPPLCDFSFWVEYTKIQMKFCLFYLLTNLRKCGIIVAPAWAENARIFAITFHYNIFSAICQQVSCTNFFPKSHESLCILTIDISLGL